MTRNEAIELMLCRVHPLPPEDDPVWEQLALYLEANPDLADWYAQGTAAEQELKSALSGLPTIETPKALPIPAVVSTSRRHVLRIAASVTLLGGAAAAWLARPVAYRHAGGAADYAAFCEDMCIYADRLLKLDHEDEQIHELRGWLSAHPAPSPEKLPPAVEGRPAKGCKVVPWGERAVGLICFHKEDGHLVHIFSLPSSVLNSVPTLADMVKPRLFDGREVVGWPDDKVINILVPAERGTSTKELLA
jgi:hypothetical protein